MFCRVVGSAKITDGITHVMALNISKLSSANEITTPLLETKWIRMKLGQLKKNNTSNDSQFPNSVITLSPQQRLIYTIVKVSLFFSTVFLLY
jgi:replication factor A2